MKVLFVSAEVAPFAKVGGLADVAGSLPAALRRAGVDARVIMPGYGSIQHFKYEIRHYFSFDFHHRNGTHEVKVFGCERDGVQYYFVQCWPYFGQENTVYTDFNWDVPRFILFNQVALAVAWQLAEREEWLPDILHCHDWHTGLLPFLLADSRWKQEWKNVGSVMTIHNIAYQGSGVGGYLWNTGIAGRHHQLLEQFGLTDNMLGIGIGYSDVVTTVSPTYSTEIQYPYAGYELAGLMRTRVGDLRGILNGIDMDLWNPASDRCIVARYDTSNFEEMRAINKRSLQSVLGLPLRDDVPMIGVVSRITRQKGFDLALPALHQLFQEQDAQLVLLGTGDSDLEYEFSWLALRFGDRVRAEIRFDVALAQQIYAGCDVFLMPSHFEPCGIGQMVAMRYGALPLVRETGGLADTVENYDNGPAEYGTGFVFKWEEPNAVLGTLRWALETYRTKRPAWKRMQLRAMETDFSWQSSAQKYIDVYLTIMDRLT